MKELTLQEQKDTALSVLRCIDEICRANGFTYSLAYGTLLGAVRHGGFIPWDDDIDIMMPRKDFLRFIRYCREHETGFALASSYTDPDYGYIFAKACDTNTRVVPDNMRWKKHGIQVDVFPVEELGPDRETARRRFGRRRFQRELLVAWNWERFENAPNRSRAYNAVRFAFFVLSRLASNRRLARSVQEYYSALAEEKSEYVGIVCGAYRSREIMPRSVYDGYTDMTFEGESFRVIAAYDEYLRTVYGDYMCLPPEERRVTHHNFKAYGKDDHE